MECQLRSKVEKWADRLQKEGLVDFAIEHLQKNNVPLPTDNRRRSAAGMPRRQQLVEMVLGLQGSDAGKLRYRLLLESVRQQRASRVRNKEGRLIKRLDLRESICVKLAAMSRATRQRESTVVEELITDEDAVRKGESVALKRQRQKIKEDSKKLREREGELKAAGIELSRREESFDRRLARLAAFEKLLSAIIECDVDDLDVQINIDQGDGIESLIAFSSSSGSSASVKPLADAWNELLGQFGESARHI
ncbi:MAG: hypothetical protein CME36_00085 [unclassified Hahellaceae]|nr:hypothetical protein [Hahellaceae bacterium]